MLQLSEALRGCVQDRIKDLLIRRHGKEDFTIVTQKQMLETLGSVLDVLTFAVMALGSISLLVGGVGVLTVMTIAVSERVGEIGLLRALGATRRQVPALPVTLSVSFAALAVGVACGIGLIAGVGPAWRAARWDPIEALRAE